MEFFAETLDRAEWDRDVAPLTWNETLPGPSTALVEAPAIPRVAEAPSDRVGGRRPHRRSPLEALDKLVLVHRLREVVALLGFTRFEAIGPDKDGEIDLDVERAALVETMTWLPAMENRGEGVFVSFDADRVARWCGRAEVRAHGRRLESAWRAWAGARHREQAGFPGLPYVMLHSLAHMLMSSIALECGYPASALRERVYAGEGRYGILIYTGASDSEGTLGGLVDTGRRYTLMTAEPAVSEPAHR